MLIQANYRQVHSVLLIISNLTAAHQSSETLNWIHLNSEILE